MIVYSNFKFSNLKDMLSFYKLSNDNVRKLIYLKGIKVNDEIVNNVDYKLNKYDLIYINESLIKQNKYVPYKYDIEILYEDNDIVLVNKPAFMLVHPDGNTNETLVNALSYYYKDQDVIFEHLHRLDFETSGIVMFSKNILAHSYLVSLFEERKITKKYICLCHGYFQNKEGFIDKPIGKDRHSNNKQIVYKDGKSAYTKYKVIENAKISKLEVEIKGGRKHQIRVHMAHIKHPLCGDKLYGIKDNFDSLCLKFVYIKFVHPRTLKEFEYKLESEI